MGLFDGMKERFGFSQQQEWDPNAAYDENGEYMYEEGFEPIEQDGYLDSDPDVVSFDAYNPSNFTNVSLDSDYEPQVAPLTGSGYSSRSRGYSSTSSYSSRRSSSSSRRFDSGASAGATWETPADPAFLDPRPQTSERDLLDQIGATMTSTSSDDPYQEFDSDIRSIHRDPGARLEIVKPKVYADVEKIATGSKAGKTVVLVLTGTKPDLAKRILDFSFGVASALNKNVDKADDKVFVISKGAEMLSSDERAFLVKKGVLG